MAGRDVDPDASPATRRRPLPDGAELDSGSGLLAEPAPRADPLDDPLSEWDRLHGRDRDAGPPTQAVSGIVDTGEHVHAPAGGNGAHRVGTEGRGAARKRRRAGGGDTTAHEDDRGRGAGTPLRRRVLPRSLLGITCMILAFSVGAAFSGTLLYSYYQYRLDQTNQRVDRLVDGYKRQFRNAEGDLSAAAANAKAEIQSELDAGDRGQVDPATQQALVRKLAKSLYFVSTENASGAPSVGTAFVVASNATESLLLTSYTTIKAATTVPGPAVYVRHGNGGSPRKVSVRTWDAADDLALIVLPTPNLPAVTTAPAKPAPQIGQPVFAVAGDGTDGGSIASGEIDDVSSAGIADDIPLGPAFQGAPIVDRSGQVVAVASRTYAPLGVPPDAIWYAPFVDAACQQVLNCPGGKIASSS